MRARRTKKKIQMQICVAAHGRNYQPTNNHHGTSPIHREGASAVQADAPLAHRRRGLRGSAPILQGRGARLLPQRACGEGLEAGGASHRVEASPRAIVRHFSGRFYKPIPSVVL